MEFGLGVWVFQNTGSVLDFSGVAIATILPPVLILPIAGNLADRADCRYVLAAASSVTACMVVILAVLYVREGLHVWHIYLFNIVVSIANALRWPAYQASLAKLLSNEQMSSASGAMGVGSGLASIIGPVVAGAMISVVGLMGLISFNAVALLMAILLILIALFYRNQNARAFKPNSQSSNAGVLGGMKKALSFLRSEPLMLALLVYMLIQSSLTALASNMLTPLILAHYSARELGIILTCGTLGAMAGSIALMLARLEKRLMISMLFTDAILSVCIFTVGSVVSVAVYCGAAFIALFAGTFGAGCAEALWLRKAHREYQGSIYGLIGTTSVATTAIVIAAAGFLVDRVLEPAMAKGGAWERWFGSVPLGKGQGVASLYVASGIVGILLSLIALTNVRMRRLDSLVPEASESYGEGVALKDLSVSS